MKNIFSIVIFLGGILSSQALAQSLSFSPEVALEARSFFEDPRLPGQLNTFQGGVILTGEARWSNANRDLRFVFEPYVRLDSEDDERTYADIRELSLTIRRGDWDWLVGVSQVFWGVAESRNVVDVINTFDNVEDFDQVEKLGQPMIRLSRRGNFGTLEAYYLPYFREQRFVGEDGRIRFDAVVDHDAVSYERSGDAWAGDFALRYTNRFGDFDLGLHAFHGTNRSPLLLPSQQAGVLVPFYQELSQAGVDIQYTRGPWLIKGEAVLAEIGDDRFSSAVGGFEYTFFDVARQGWDLGMIGEWLYDDRDTRETPVTLFEDDLFAGIRITLNDVQDTEILAGAIIDADEHSVIGSIEFQRRIGTNAKLEIEGRYFQGEDNPLLIPLDQDSHLTLRLTRYF